MFDIVNYDVYLAFCSLAVYSLLLFFLFRRKIVAIVDPLVMHLFWLSSHFSFLTVFLVKYGLSVFVVIFLSSIFGYTFLLNMFIVPTSKRQMADIGGVFKVSNSKLLLIYLLVVALYFYSKRKFFAYILTHQFSEWFLYRFIKLQEGDALSRIVEIGVGPMFLFLFFLYIFLLRKYKFLVGTLLLLSLILNILSGGRSALLGLIFSFGSFLVCYKDFFNTKIIRRINVCGFLFTLLGIFLTVVVSSMYSYSFTL